jgi:hypothetical protein
MKAASKQIALKPQDLLVLFKMACHQDRAFTYAQLAEAVGISASEAHSSLRRAARARLVFDADESMAIQRPALKDFVLHGARYCFPASLGAPTAGMATGHAAPPLRELLVQSEDLPPVWPQPNGSVRGVALYPLYRTVAAAAARDSKLYECLALFDALRAGTARERELAQQLLSERL